VTFFLLATDGLAHEDSPPSAVAASSQAVFLPALHEEDFFSPVQAGAAPPTRSSPSFRAGELRFLPFP